MGQLYRLIKLHFRMNRLDRRIQDFKDRQHYYLTTTVPLLLQEARLGY